MKSRAARKRMMPLRSWLLAVMALLLLPLGGCGFVDIDKRFFVVAVAIDKSGSEQKPYRITLRLSIPNSKIEPGMEKSQVETIEAAEISEGVRRIKALLDKELDLGHCKMFVLGKKLSHDDISDAVDWMVRRRDIQGSAYVAMAGSQGYDILQKMPLSERYSGNSLFLTFGGDGTRSSYIRTEHLFDLQRRRTERGMDPYLPVIRTTGNGYEVDRLALLDKTKVRTILTPEETQLFNQLDQQYVNSIIKTKLDGHPIILTATDISSRYTVSSNGILKMKVNIAGAIEEAPNNVFNQDWGELQKMFERDLEKDAMALFQKIQKAGVDPFGFGLRYRATHLSSRAYQEWLEMYPRLKFEIQAKVKIQGTGLIK